MAKPGSSDIALSGMSSTSTTSTPELVTPSADSSSASGISSRALENPMFLALRDLRKDDGLFGNKDGGPVSDPLSEYAYGQGKIRTFSSGEIAKSGMKLSQSEFNLAELKAQPKTTMQAPQASTPFLSVPLSSQVALTAPGLSEARQNSYGQQQAYPSSLSTSAPHSRKSSMSTPTNGFGYSGGLVSGSFAKLDSHSSMSASNTDLNIDLNSGRSSLMNYSELLPKEEVTLVDKLEEMKETLLYDMSYKIENGQGSLDLYVDTLRDKMTSLRALKVEIQNKIELFVKESKTLQMDSELQIEKINLIQKDIEVIDELYDRLSETKLKLSEYKQRLANVSQNVEEQESVDHKRYIRVRYVKRTIFAMSLAAISLGICLKNGLILKFLLAPIYFLSRLFGAILGPEYSISPVTEQQLSEFAELPIITI